MSFLESLLYGLGSFIGNGIASAGERMGGHVPAGRPMDKIKSNRRMKGEKAELYNLYTRLGQQSEHAKKTVEELCWRVVKDVLSQYPRLQELSIVEGSYILLRDLLVYEEYFPLLEIDFTQEYSIGKTWDFAKTVRRQLAFYAQPKKQQEIEEGLRAFLTKIVAEGLPNIQSGASDDDGAILVPFASLHLDLAASIEALYRYVFRNPEDDGLFSQLGKDFQRNLMLASGGDPSWIDRSDAPDIAPILPTHMQHKSALELVYLYLDQTPFANFFYAPIPFTIPYPARFEHTHVVGGSGHGKTQLLQTMIFRDLQRIREGKGSVVIIDSQGDMLRKIGSLAEVGDIAENVVIIDPADIAHPPALNLLDFGLDRLSRFSPLEREQLINGAIALYEYVFGALLGAELTNRQGVVFRYLARLLMIVPGATVHTLIDFMENPEKTRPYIAQLDGITARFFQTQFFSTSFNDTRQQILTRLYSVLSNAVLDRMFNNERNKVNLFDAMNRGSLILINTAKDLLKQEGCEILGRFFIALICQAAQERASIPEHMRTDTFVYIDEAHDYFDESMENLLNQARKYRCGLVLAHQNLDQFDTKLRATVMASTSIKIVGGLSAKDAQTFSRDMRCEPEFLLSMRKFDDSTQFACYVRNHTESPLMMTIPFGTVERRPRMAPEILMAMIHFNREKYCAGGNDTSDPYTQEWNTQEWRVVDRPQLRDGRTPDEPELL